MTAREEPRIFSEDQQAEMLKILSGRISKSDTRLFYVARADRFMRTFNKELRFSSAASLLYLYICGCMGASRGCADDEAAVSAATIANRWMIDLHDRGVQRCIRELTLTGPLPLLEKRRTEMPSQRNVYGFVLDPFALAERQHAEARDAQPRLVKVKTNDGAKDRLIYYDVATRAPIVIVESAAQPERSAVEQPSADPDLLGFDQFWLAYPKKHGRAKAEHEWRRARVAEQGLLPQVLQALSRQCREWDDPRFIPNPATWLHDGRWVDSETTTVTTVAQPMTAAEILRQREATYDTSVVVAEARVTTGMS